VARECDPLGFWEKVSIRGIGFRQRAGRWGQALLRPGSWVIGGFAVVYAICALLKVEEIPSKNAWWGSEPLGVVLWVSGVLALVGTFLVFIGYGRTLKKLSQNDELDEACKGAGTLRSRR
jgi:hypothetical protein